MPIVRSRFCGFLPALVLSVASFALASGEEREGEGAASRERTGVEYAIQGEYVGMTSRGPVEGEEFKIGAQIIARGDGVFEGYSYLGGLPGEGFDPKRSNRSGPFRFTLRDGAAVSEEKGSKVVIRDGILTHYAADGSVIGRAERVERKSKTLGKKPPEGAVVLFGGKDDVEKWHGGKLTEEGYLLRGTHSKERFQDCRIHLEFRTPFEPSGRGQARGNSGVYVQRRYEVQILDSFGEKPAHDLCGGIYSVRAPDVNMCFPPLVWQTYDIEFRAARFKDSGKGGKPVRVEDARMSVWHNGVLIHKDVPVPKEKTTAAPESESPEPGAIYLQDHGHRVVYRNIWVVPK